MSTIAERKVMKRMLEERREMTKQILPGHFSTENVNDNFEQQLQRAQRDAWIQCYLGGEFWPLKPRASDVFSEDIAHHLSNMCRFTGACKRFYSVGEHSVRVSYLLEQSGFDVETVFAGLMHDAAEAYCVDLPRPIKRCMREYGPIEEGVSKVIWERFRIQVAVDDERIKTADEILLATEKRDLMGPSPRDWKLREAPMLEHIRPLTPDQAKEWFLGRFDLLMTKRDHSKIPSTSTDINGR